MKKNTNKRRSTTGFDEPIIFLQSLQTSYLQPRTNKKAVKLKLDEDPLHQRVHFLPFMNSLKYFLSQFSEIYMLLMDYPYIRGEYLPDYAKRATWNLFHKYTDAHSQVLIDEFPGYGVQSISILK